MKVSVFKMQLRVIVLLVFALFALGQATSLEQRNADGPNPKRSGYYTIDGKEYYINEEIGRGPWDEAVAFCQSIGMELISLETQEKSDTILSWFANNGGYGYWLWTSGKYSQSESAFVWTAINQPLNWAGSWAPGFPKNYGAPCAAISLYTTGWWDEQCISSDGLMCEYVTK